METLEIEKRLEKQHNFYCEFCKCIIVSKSKMDRHLSTDKHKNAILETKKAKKGYDDISCECGKIYKTKSGLWKHKKICNFLSNLNNIDNHSKDLATLSSNVNNNIELNKDGKLELNKDNNLNKKKKIMINKDSDRNNNYKDIICLLMQENKDFKNLLVKQQEQISELIPKIGNNNTQNIKQKFNINIFLNEQCKDAININDFVKSIEISLEQLNSTNSGGLITGLSNAIIENMNKLSLYERPLHCTDSKRETLYIKDEDVWEKDKDKTIIKKAIRDISSKQYKTLQSWIEKNPDFKEIEEKQEYFTQTLANIGKDINEIDEKIIKKISNAMYVKEINEN
jgi:hypothetical protein|tara:strand:+ start:5896 stop:6915 length:1020 start_codon:yes stop_codon:yes gene_type:complete